MRTYGQNEFPVNIISFSGSLTNPQACHLDMSVFNIFALPQEFQGIYISIISTPLFNRYLFYRLHGDSGQCRAHRILISTHVNIYITQPGSFSWQANESENTRYDHLNAIGTGTAFTLIVSLRSIVVFSPVKLLRMLVKFFLQWPYFDQYIVIYYFILLHLTTI